MTDLLFTAGSRSLRAERKRTSWDANSLWSEWYRVAGMETLPDDREIEEMPWGQLFLMHI